jgi:aminomuconate-semialdehyde/2-hydroxymuconate-6-semialdehyde dehydrogenase
MDYSPNVPKEQDSIPGNNTLPVLKNYVNGEWKLPSSGKYIQNVNPSTNHVISYIHRSTKEDVVAACEHARESFERGTWQDLDEEVRAKYIDKIADKIEERFEEFVIAESKDTGKPESLARMIDIPRAIANFRFFATAIVQQQTGCHYIGKRALNYTVRRPIGVCALISPWNLPIYLLSWKVAPALAMGNCVVCKPSELSPTTAHLLAEVIDSVLGEKFKGVFNLVHGYGREAGQALVEDRNVSLVSFTGGTATGVQVGKTASSQFKKLSLELGGKNSMVVFDDCDFEKSVELAKRAAFSNSGQICLCTSRIFIQESIYDMFVTEFIKTVSKIKVGDPKDKTTTMGPLISVEHREKIEYYVKLGLEEGGKILHGGKRPGVSDEFKNGAFYEPTVFADLDPFKSRVSTEEIFGCVVSLHKFKTSEEVLKMVNHVNYGLCASILTQNVQNIHKFADKIHVGMVWVNCWLLRDLRVPFGGVKDSGVGREGGAYSLEFYSEDKNICIEL